VNVARVGRKRRAAGWFLAIVGGVAVGWWFCSRWWTVSCASPHGYARAEHGCLTVSNSSYPQWTWCGWKLYGDQRQWLATTGSMKGPAQVYNFDWWVISRLPPAWGGETVWHVAAWPVPLVLWLGAAPLIGFGVWARRRALEGRCIECGYDLRGLKAGAVCPECGKGRVQ
jgi:hypothetical protein